jgi:CHAT domain-containing protein
VGEVRNGDGVNGLRRSLLLAGARSQVASLWKVADLPTKQLMISFYQGLVRGEGRSAALRRAQLQMLASPALSHLYYWASFTAIGNWTPLPVD